MGTYLTRRAVHSFFALAGLLVLVFFLARLTGDPGYLYLPLDATLDARQEFSEKHGFNDPIYVQFGRFLVQLSFGDLGDSLMKARPAAILFEGANPRHDHEWEDIENAKIPDHKVLVPGVVDSTSNFVEHPRLIAQRICRYAGIVGRERVIAGTDCGFGTFARREPTVAPSVVWSKFRAMEEGARIATDRLWS